MAMNLVSRLVLGGVALALVLGAADRASIAGGGGTANVPHIPAIPEMPIPAMPALPPAIEAPEPPAEAAPSPAVPVQPEPYGVHRNPDGSWSLDPGCRWVNPDDSNDLRAVCN
jgi:hypothetical protein